MNSRGPTPQAEAELKERPKGDPDPPPRFGLADRVALQGIFRWLCFFAVYLVVIQLCGMALKWGRLSSALVEFLPYCLVLVGVGYRGRTLARRDKQTLLMVSCLVCVFIVFGLDVTKNVRWFDAVPLLGRDSRLRNDIASVAIVAAITSFPAASYFMLKELMLMKKHLDDQLDRLQEALGHVRTLQGLLPICMHCHKIRTDQQSWQRIELYIMEHSDAKFTHGVCPECARKHYPELNL